MECCACRFIGLHRIRVCARGKYHGGNDIDHRAKDRKHISSMFIFDFALKPELHPA